MSKVVAPLQSFSASGKVGKSIVFFSHLGRNVVRGLVTPANPKSETQGDSRLLLGGIGRSARGVARPSDYHNEIVENVASGQTWVSSLVTFVIGFYGSGATGVAALNAAVDGHSATNWQAEAESRGLTDVTVDYAAAAEQTITAGAQLYILAQYAIARNAQYPDMFDSAPYTTALADWASSEVASHATYLGTVA